VTLDRFDPPRAARLLMASEGKAPLHGISVGHTLARHVGLSNERLMDRLRYEGTNGNINWYSCFESVRQAADAASLVLNTLPRELNRMRLQRLNQYSCTLQLHVNFNVRFAFGNGVLRLSADRMHIALARTAEASPFPYMIVTFYACIPDEIVPVP
jgi:hypothetical protein